MYDQLVGEILRKGPTSVVVDVRGIGFFLEASLRTTARLPVGAEATILVHHRQTEDSVRLFGFADEPERELFRRLLKVSGVGPAHALALLSAASPEDLWAALRDGNERRLTSSKGIGPKIAQRLITELRDEAGRRSPAGRPVLPGPLALGSTEDDAVGALVVLGYTEPGALKAVQAAKKRLGDDAAVDALVREALKER